MKRVNLRSGLKQRMNEIIGTDDGMEGAVPGITPWSVEAAMIANLRRIVKGVVGNASVGRPMYGLELSVSSNPTKFDISAGVGFTNSGNIVVFDAAVNGADVTVSALTVYVYIEHRMAVVPGSDDDGKETNFIGKSGPPQDIVYDDYAASQKSSISTEYNTVLVQSSTEINTNDDLIHLGTLTLDSPGGSIVNITPSAERGLSPNMTDGTMLLNKLKTVLDCTVGGTLIANLIQSNNTINPIVVDSPLQIEDDRVITLPGGTNKVQVGNSGPFGFSGTIPAANSIQVTNGIITGSTAPP